MNGKGHRPFGALAHLAVTPAVVHQPPTWTLVGTLAAMGTAAGPCSPDADQSPLVGFLTGGHRHLTHCPETLGVATWAAIHYDMPGVLAAPILAAWWAHVLIDAGWGGVPIPTPSLLVALLPGVKFRPWRRWGWTFKTGGFLETGTVRRGRVRLLPFGLAPVAATLAAIWLIGGLYGAWPAVADGIGAVMEHARTLEAAL